jgi:hypothetical protein
MKRETAEQIIDASRRIDKILEELGSISWTIDDEDERKTLRRGIADCIFTLYQKVTREAVLKFPDLHPDFPDGDWPGASGETAGW